MIFNQNRMPEAEVSLRLAMFLIEKGMVEGTVNVSIDGAQIRTGSQIHFQIEEFLYISGIMKLNNPGKWQGEYQLKTYENYISIHSRPGEGDVIARLNSGKKIFVESKKGDLVRNKSSQEYPLLREALGQLITANTVEEDSLIFVAVPKSDKNIELINRWKDAPLIKKIGLGFITVDREQNVFSTLAF